jgi:putative peptidoglycan lipid II flippase
MLWLALKQRGGFAADARLERNLPLIIIASVAMGLGLAALIPMLSPYLAPEAGLWLQALALAALVAAGMLVFGASVLATGVLSPGQFGRLFRRGRA